ncbi:MAG: amino acid ABC transporter permease [Proteobacteria bacterium]|nr:amino acid ABC transporter permease [Pseudomonadota bacterium]
MPRAPAALKPKDAFVDWSILWQYRGAFWSGFTVTVWLSAACIVGSTIVGLLAGCLGSLPSFFLRRLISAYTELLRNIPLVVKLFFFYFVLGIPGIPAALLALTLHQSAYVADVVTAGIRSIARGQVDAGLSLGHGYWQIFRYLIIPQMLRIVIPPMTSQYVAIIKHSSVVGLVAVQDLTFQTQEINVATFRGFEAATATTVLYGLLALAMIAAMAALEKRFAWR